MDRHQSPELKRSKAPASRPTRQDLQAASEKKISDLTASELRVLFCGINPGLYSAATGHHFARPGNRFWPALHASGFTPRLLFPHEERELLSLQLGITNIVDRASATADELSAEELIAGARKLQDKVKQFRPRYVAILGIGAYRTGFVRPGAVIGSQTHAIGSTQVWILPSPSGLNAHYQPKELARVFREFRDAVDAT
ncbi:MAG TPA: G/U mismatch-specific DNA glycosylase [Humisphaera sp.]|nr:G/U mismatch-specific DNA glycosylase [Humisphaera sp.]